MGNTLCKNRTNKSASNTSSGKNPVDRVIGQCMQICPNGLGKKKHFWEKQVLETSPPPPPLNEQPKPENKDGWQSASLSVPSNDEIDHPIAPPRKKRSGTLPRDANSAKNGFEEVFLSNEKLNVSDSENDDDRKTTEISIERKYQESIEPTSIPAISTDCSDPESKSLITKRTRKISKVGNKKSDKFFGESLSDLSVEPIVDEKLANEENIKIESISKQQMSLDKSDAENKVNDDKESSKQSEEIDSVMNLVEDVEEELARKITQEKGKMMFSLEKHLTKDQNEDEKYKDEIPVEEEIIVPVKKVVRRHICDEDEQLGNILHHHHHHHHHYDDVDHVEHDDHDHYQQIDSPAPKKPQRDFAKFKKSIEKQDIIQTSQQLEDSKQKRDNETQTGRGGVIKAANHIKTEVSSIVKNSKNLIEGVENDKNLAIKEAKNDIDSNVESMEKSAANATLIAKSEMENILNKMEKLRNEVKRSHFESPDEREVKGVAEEVVEDVLNSAENSVNTSIAENDKYSNNIKSYGGEAKEDLNQIKSNIQNTNIILYKTAENVKNKVDGAVSSVKQNTEQSIDKIKEESNRISHSADQLKNDSKSFANNIKNSTETQVKANKEAAAVKFEQISNSFNNVKNEIEKKNIDTKKDLQNTAKNLVDTTNNNLKEIEISTEESIEGLKKDAAQVINEVVEFAEKTVNDRKNNPENFAKSANTVAEDEALSKVLNGRSNSLLNDENATVEQFLQELKNDAAETIKDVVNFAEKSVKNNSNIVVEKSSPQPSNINLVSSERSDLMKTENLTNDISNNNKLNDSLPLRPTRTSEIIAPNLIQNEKVLRRSLSSQFTDNKNIDKNTEKTFDAIINTLSNDNKSDNEKSKSTNNILNNNIGNGLPPRPTRTSEISIPKLSHSEKFLRRCLSTQSYLTPNLIEKIAQQASILSMPDGLSDDISPTNDGSGLVTPMCRLDSKRSLQGSQSSVVSEKSDSDVKLNILPKNQSIVESNTIVQKQTSSIPANNNKNEISTPSLEPKELNIETQNSSIHQEKSPAKSVSKIPELPKNKLTKRLSRTPSRQSNIDESKQEMAKEISETIKKFLSEKDLKPQEILDLIEFEFGDCMFSQYLSDDDRKIIEELKKSIEPPQKTKKIVSPIEEKRSFKYDRQHSQDSDSSPKKSPDRGKSSKIPVFKNKNIIETANADVRRHSIDDLSSWFSPEKEVPVRRRKRESSLPSVVRANFNKSEENLLKQNEAVKEMIDEKTKLIEKSANVLIDDVLDKADNKILTFFADNEKNEDDHSALLKFLENEKESKNINKEK